MIHVLDFEVSMSREQHPNKKTKKAKKDREAEHPESPLQKRLIWQHLTQKKIKKALKARFNKDLN